MTGWEKMFATLSQRRRAYRMCFAPGVPQTDAVLLDLAKFCRAQTPCLGADNDETNRLIGRNEVWCRIVQHLRLSEVDLFSLYAKLSADQRQALFDPNHQVKFEDTNA